ncbi:MAG TPA: MazG-like family protein [Cellvibrio sp.]|nr:MazG-like family protein [Cellvibrio sp.]
MSEIKRDAHSDQLHREQLLNITKINSEFRAIAVVNEWQAYHTPKNLAAAVAVEASELLAEFQWLSAEDSKMLNPQQKSQVADEVADVIMYLTELCAQLDINMADAVKTKIDKNKQRFQKT